MRCQDVDAVPPLYVRLPDPMPLFYTCLPDAAPPI